MNTPYEMAKILIENDRYVKLTMTKMLGDFLKYGRITQEEYDELIKMMEDKENINSNTSTGNSLENNIQ